MSAATAVFGLPDQGWLDLSTGLNPAPYPNLSVSQTAFAALPLASAQAGLLAAARRAYGLPETASLCAAPGTQALIQIVPNLYPPTSVAIVSPTYGEHAHVWREAGHETTEIAALEDARDARIVIVTNPNNPDGRQFKPAILRSLYRTLAKENGLLIVDEAFADVLPRVSLASDTGQPGLIVLRSFGKFFGLGGLRLGFAAGPASWIQKIEARLGPWAVSGPAIEIGTRALNDTAWAAAARTTLTGLRQRLEETLGQAGLTIIGSTDLFVLAEHTDAPKIYLRLGQAGILVRPFADHPTWLRFGLPGTDAAFARLENALS